MAAHCSGEIVFFALDAESSRDRAAPRRGRPRRPSSATARSFWPRATARKSSSRSTRLPLTRNGQVGFPGGKLPGRDRRRLVAGHPAGRDPRRAESIAADIDKVPGRFNVLGDRRGHGRGRLRPQCPLVGGRDRSPRQRSRTRAARASTRRPATAATATSFARANCWARPSTG